MRFQILNCVLFRMDRKAQTIRLIEMQDEVDWTAASRTPVRRRLCRGKTAECICRFVENNRIVLFQRMMCATFCNVVAERGGQI